MKVILKIDYDGNPYLLLKSEKSQLRLSESSIEDELLELFIRKAKAKAKGIVLKNESDMETREGEWLQDSCVFVEIEKKQCRVMTPNAKLSRTDDYMSIRIKGKENENDCN